MDILSFIFLGFLLYIVVFLAVKHGIIFGTWSFNEEEIQY